MDAEEQFLSGACIYKIFPKIVAQRHSRGLRNRRQRHNTRTEEELATILQSLKTTICLAIFTNVELLLGV